MPEFKPAKFAETKSDDLPRDPLGDGAGWSFKTMEHDQHRFPTARGPGCRGQGSIYVPLEFAGKIGRWIKPKD